MMSARTLKLTGILLIGLALLFLAGAFWATAEGEVYTVYTDGDVLQVSGSYATVDEVISAAVPNVSPLDVVIPDRRSVANPAVAISVQRAKPVIVQTEEERTTYFTHQETLGGFLHEIRFNLSSSDQIIADDLTVGLFDLETAALPEKLEIKKQIDVVIVDDGFRQTLSVDGQTVGDALNQAGITIFVADETRPSLEAWLSPNMEIQVIRSSPVTIFADGRTIDTRTPHSKVLPILASAGISLIGADYTIPAAGNDVPAGGSIQVVRVTEDFVFEDSPIPFESELIGTDQFEIDTRGLLQAGVPGIQRKRFKVTLENGVEVNRVPDGEFVAQDPVTEQVGYGTKIIVRTVDTPEGPLEYYRKVEMRVTSYMAQTSGKPPDHPAYGITRSGVIAGYGVVAVDPKVVPFRSNVYVPGYGSAFVGDTGGGVLGRWIDLGYEDDWDTFQPWAGYIDVYYLTPVPDASDINFLIPTVLP